MSKIYLNAISICTIFYVSTSFASHPIGGVMVMKMEEPEGEVSSLEKHRRMHIPEATVEVVASYSDPELERAVNLKALNDKVNMGEPSNVHASTGLSGVSNQDHAHPEPCAHDQGHDYLPSGYVSATWENPRDGEQLFFNKFNNQTNLPQSYCQEVSGTIASTFDGTLSLDWACAKVGTSRTVTLKHVYNVAVPARSEITMRANANMMDRSLGMLVRCVKCKNVLSVYNNTITSAVGINEYFSN